MRLPFHSYDNYILYFSFMQNLFLRVFFLFHFSVFAFSKHLYCSWWQEQQWLALFLHVLRERELAGIKPCFPYGRLETALKRYRLFFFSETRVETHEQIARLMPNHLLIHIRKILVNAPPTSVVGNPNSSLCIGNFIPKYMLLVTH